VALSPMLVIGCGGSGGKVVLGLRRRLEEELQRRGWRSGLPRAWQLKWIDVPTVQEDHPEFGAALPPADYLGLSKVSQYEITDGALIATATNGHLARLVGWRPTPKLSLPVNKGAGQMRGVGRAVALTRTEAISALVKSSTAAIAGSAAELAQLGRSLGGSGLVDETPTVFVLTSMAGGTGAGIFMDVCDVIRGVDPRLNPNIFSILFTAEVFKDVGADAGMIPNTAAALAELMSGYGAADRSVEPLYGKLGAVDFTGQSGPTIPLIVGMQPLDGGEPLSRPAQCYRAVTETLLAAVINERFQQAFVGSQVTNFAPNADGTYRQTAFGMLNQPRSEGDEVVPCGVVSSFGSSVVSVGSGRFGEWAQHRLSRAVLDHIVGGWKDLGRQLMGHQLSPSTTDQDVVDFLVARDRAAFVDGCGLSEENEPNGVEHNQVLEGVLGNQALAAIRDRFRTQVLAELAQVGSAGAASWQSNIDGVVNVRRMTFMGEVEKALVEGVEVFCASVVTRVSDTVSEWLARFGVPVTQGLVAELRQQCLTAKDQLTADGRAHEQKSHQDPAQYVLGAFQALGNGKCASDSDFVKNGLAQALGPLAFAAAKRRCEVAVNVLDRVVQRLITPLIAELDDVGAKLGDDDIVKQIKGWPDDGGDVAAVYRPAPSEFVLMQPERWNDEYQRLLSNSAGSAAQSRDIVAGGGFEYGPVVDRQTAPLMVEFDQTARWWDPNSGHVAVKTRLRPAEVLERTRMWMWDDNHAMGKFMRIGLGEYLEGTGAQRQTRLNSFEQALTRAVALAKPLIRVDTALLQRVHPGKDDLTLDVVCEQFPFTPANDAARAIVERVMAAVDPPDDGWFMTGNTHGVERILITSILDKAVQPAVVASLTAPIAATWNQICQSEKRRDSIAGFRTYNRARLLSESIPLTKPALDRVIRGWFLGRLFGTISSATETQAFSVRHHSLGQLREARLPWPVLRHGSVSELHSRSYQAEWLPALLEQLPLAMMMIGIDPNSLDGYEQLFQLGDRAQTLIEDWIVKGDTPTGSRDGCQLSGATDGERKASLLEALTELLTMYELRRTKAVLSPAWAEFIKIPYGYELLPDIEDALAVLASQASNVSTGGAYG
jgi:Tubulin like